MHGTETGSATAGQHQNVAAVVTRPHEDGANEGREALELCRAQPSVRSEIDEAR